ncbi:MAG: hypothetical protein SH808_12220 [Saprospiraceae bacterium]|nr:hypothetical protein [Saprospiraceae bacterium]
MQRVSSQLTIILRIAIPTIWLTTILSIVILLSWAVRGKAGLFGNPFIWLGLLLILGSGFAIIKLLLLRFYRVDMDSRFIHVSNYFKTYKYPFSEVESISDSKILPGRVFLITLKAKGSFGKKIYFLAAQMLWQDFLKEHPGLIEVKSVRREA